MAWPASHVQLIGEFLRKQTFPETRIEALLARLAHDVHNANYKPALKLQDFFPSNPWPAQKSADGDRYSDADRQMLSAFMARRGKK